MNEYLVVKWVHVLSSTILFGTGIGSAFYMFFASRQPDPKVAHFVVRHVVIADWLFTTTAIIVQPATGLWLAHIAGFPLTATWLLGSIVLYFVAGACWLPVVWIQYQMRAMALAAAESKAALPERFHRLFRVWVALGVPAFLALVVVFYLMVAKPA
jgi:uncharacterized membrane protein